MSKRSQALWELAERGRGRPGKAADGHSRPRTSTKPTTPGRQSIST